MVLQKYKMDVGNSTPIFIQILTTRCFIYNDVIQRREDILYRVYTWTIFNRAQQLLQIIDLYTNI